jgi:hypothetical protein
MTTSRSRNSSPLPANGMRSRGRCYDHYYQDFRKLLAE